MLIRTQEFDEKGRRLYVNKLTGTTAPLVLQEFYPSSRKDRRSIGKNDKKSQSKKTGEMFRQIIKMDKKQRVVWHYSNASLSRKVKI